MALTCPVHVTIALVVVAASAQPDSIWLSSSSTDLGLHAREARGSAQPLAAIPGGPELALTCYVRYRSSTGLGRTGECRLLSAADVNGIPVIGPASALPGIVQGHFTIVALRERSAVVCWLANSKVACAVATGSSPRVDGEGLAGASLKLSFGQVLILNSCPQFQTCEPLTIATYNAVQAAPLLDAKGLPTEKLVVCWLVQLSETEPGLEGSLMSTVSTSRASRFCGSLEAGADGELQLSGTAPDGSQLLRLERSPLLNKRAGAILSSLMLTPLSNGRTVACYMEPSSASEVQGVCRLLLVDSSGQVTAGDRLIVGTRVSGTSVVAVGSLGPLHALACYWQPEASSTNWQGHVMCDVLTPDGNSTKLRSLTIANLNSETPVLVTEGQFWRPVVLDVASLSNKKSVVFWQYDVMPNVLDSSERSEHTVGTVLHWNGTALSVVGNLENWRSVEEWNTEDVKHAAPRVVRVAALGLGSYHGIMCRSFEDNYWEGNTSRTSCSLLSLVKPNTSPGLFLILFLVLIPVLSLLLVVLWRRSHKSKGSDKESSDSSESDGG